MLVYTHAHTHKQCIRNNSGGLKLQFTGTCTYACTHSHTHACTRAEFIPIWNNQDSLKHNLHCLLFYIKVEE